jgi:predicted PurR-regulated permease PerM
MDAGAQRSGVTATLVQRGSRIADVLDRRAGLIDTLLVLAVIALSFIVLGFLAAYFENYFHLILIFFFAWLLAFLISPVADFLQRHLRRMPRALAVIAVIVPVIIVTAVIVARVAVGIGESFADLAAALPAFAANPPPLVADLQAWFDARGIAIDVAGAFHTLVVSVLEGLAGFAGAIFSGLVGAVGTFIDAIVVVSLAIFMAIDRDRIMRFGLDLTPPERRDEALLFRKSIGGAFAGFIRSQLILGALYAGWALLVSLVFGLPFAGAVAVISGLIMAIPIYGPYVSWVPPVLVAVLLMPEVALIVAVAMLVGWFIDENILAPLVRAGALELHPIVVTLAFLLGAELAGAIGALVAIPLAAVVQAFFLLYSKRYREERGWPPADPSSPDGNAAAPATVSPADASSSPSAPSAG